MSGAHRVGNGCKSIAVAEQTATPMSGPRRRPSPGAGDPGAEARRDRVLPTIDPADIRGLGTTVLGSVWRRPRSRHEGRPESPLNVVEGYADIGGPGPPQLLVVLRPRGHGAGDGPHEGDQFPRDRRDRHVGMLPARHEAAVAFAEPHLCLPAEVLEGLRQAVDALLDVERDLGRMAIGPRGFDEDASGAPVAGLRDATLPSGRTTGVLGRDQPDEGGELPRVVKPREVAEFGDDRERHDPPDAAEGLQGLDQRIAAPAGCEFL